MPLTARASSVTVGNFNAGGTSDGTSNTLLVGEGDGTDTVVGGPGDDGVNVRDAALDQLVDVRTRSAKPRRVTRYRIARGRTRLVTVRGSGRYLVLSERDQRRRLRHLVRRL